MSRSLRNRFAGCLFRLLLTAAPFYLTNLAAQSPELVRAKVRLKHLTDEREALAPAIAKELDEALEGLVDTRPKGEFEATARYEARLRTARALRAKLEPEFTAKQQDREAALQARVRELTDRPYAAPIRIRLEAYDADGETFEISIRATGNKGSLPISRAVAPDLKTNLPYLKQWGFWSLSDDGISRLEAVAVIHQTGAYFGFVEHDPLHQIVGGVDDILFAAAFSPDGQILATACRDQCVHLWRVKDGELLRTLIGHTGWVKGVVFSPDGQLLISVSDDMSAKIWQVCDGRLLRNLSGHTGKLITAAFSPDGTLLATSGWDRVINVWRAADGQLLHTLKGHRKEVIALAFIGDDPILVSGANDRTVKFWDVAKGKTTRTISFVTDPILALAFSPDGELFATSSADRTIKLWRMYNGSLIRTLKGHTGWVLALAFCPDGQTLASGSHDQTARLWRVSDGALLKTMKGHVALIMSVAFSREGHFLATASGDHSAIVWRLKPRFAEEILAAALEGQLPSLARGPSLPPTLTAVIDFTEPSDNAALDAAEEGSLTITVINEGEGPAYGVEVTFRSPAAAVRFPARRYIGAIQPGESKRIVSPIRAGLDLPDGQLTLNVTFTEARGFEPDPIRLTLETRAFIPPDLMIADVGVDEPSGNGMIEPGEVVNVLVQVANRGAGPASDVAALLRLGDNVFLAEGSQKRFELGLLPPDGQATIQFQIYTNRRAVAIPVFLTITERHRQYGLVDEPLNLPFNQPVRTIRDVTVAAKRRSGGPPAPRSRLTADVETGIPRGRDERPGAVALIIANRSYRHPDVPDVTFAHRDAAYFRQYLIETLGYREENIILVEDATLAAFRTALERLINAASDDHDAFFYYTGHGAPDLTSKEGYFVPVDTDPDYVKVGGVSLSEFYAALGRVEARMLTVVIDACFSGVSHQGMLLQNASPIVLEVDPQSQLPGHVLAFTSSSGTEISSWYPEQQHGLYTYYFLSGLKGYADTDGDRNLTIGELQAYLAKQVPYMARRLYNRTQTPQLNPQGWESLVLVRYK